MDAIGLLKVVFYVLLRLTGYEMGFAGYHYRLLLRSSLAKVSLHCEFLASAVQVGTC